MVAFPKDNPTCPLELPDAFEDLSGVIASDLKVIATALAQRAGERLLLSRGQRQELRQAIWNNLARALAETLEPLDVARR
jgi:hypothetical protein